MRIASQVAAGFVLLLVLGAIWRLGPAPRYMPDVVALLAVHLGMSARGKLAPSLAGAVVFGYLGDLLMGTPRGFFALGAALLCVMGFVVHQRLLVRGALLTVVFAALVGLLSAAVQLFLTAFGGGFGGWRHELMIVGGSALLTGLAGLPTFRLCRLIDARFARTQRDRLVALEGLLR
jgi:hypothetical protein